MHIDEMNVYSMYNICIACHVGYWFVNTSIPLRQMLPLHWKAAAYASPLTPKQQQQPKIEAGFSLA